jgi:formylglycine-generating enzyme required for sulfatase activity
LIALILPIATAPWISEAKPEEPGQAPPPAADLMHGKAPGEVRDDNGLKLTLVWCPPGFLTMQNRPRDTEPAKEDVGEDRVKVLLTKGYWLGKYEVTQSEWKEVMKTEPWKGAAKNQAADFPATHVAWKDAVDFCRKLTEQERQAGRLSNDWE